MDLKDLTPEEYEKTLKYVGKMRRKAEAAKKKALNGYIIFIGSEYSEHLVEIHRAIFTPDNSDLYYIVDVCDPSKAQGSRRLFYDHFVTKEDYKTKITKNCHNIVLVKEEDAKHIPLFVKAAVKPVIQREKLDKKRCIQCIARIEKFIEKLNNINANDIKKLIEEANKEAQEDEGCRSSI